jgi:membrane-associated HD superfamily phosphohydrolase
MYMIIDKYQHPFRFYSLSLIIPWICWFVAAYLSHLTPSSSIYISIASLLGIIGLVSPMVIAFSMMLPDPELRSDLFNRLFTFKKIKPIYLLATFFLMLASILLAQGISLLFGYSAEQFNLSHGFSFTAGLFPAWFMLFLAPILEELAWHTYGTVKLGFDHVLLGKPGKHRAIAVGKPQVALIRTFMDNQLAVLLQQVT